MASEQRDIPNQSIISAKYMSFNQSYLYDHQRPSTYSLLNNATSPFPKNTLNGINQLQPGVTLHADAAFLRTVD